jgi:signal transduction histidine kinase/ActR/RegA family two-component response regulator
MAEGDSSAGGHAEDDAMPADHPHEGAELAQEKLARARAERQAEEQRRYAEAIDRLCALGVGNEELDELLARVLALFVDLSRVRAAFIALRDGDVLGVRATLGAEAARDAGLALAECFRGEPAAGDRSAALVSGAPGDASPLGAASVQRVHWLRLTHADRLIGAIVLGSDDERELPEADAYLFGVLAGRAAAVIAQRTASESLRADVRARDEVLAVVAHDLQNPLNVISMAANMLLSRAGEQSLRRPVERIVRGVQRATRLLRDLLDISAMEAGRFSVERRRVDPADLLLSALESQQSLAADASVIIASDLSPELPAVDADEERLLEVLENLVGNAVKFTSPGGSITVGAAREADEVRVWVQDSGAGIPPEQLPHIFDRFWQAKRTDRRGSGLGLTICKGIVEAHGGRIWAESSFGQGTRVLFTVPAVVAPYSAVQSTQIANILMVDDRPENLLALSAILERPDYRLVQAESGEKALRLALREPFSVALIDIAMPGMNGLEVAVHLKELERSRDIPIIFITAFGDDPEEIHRAYAAGGADYLVKPLDAEIVKKKVAVFVDLSRRRHANDPPLGERTAQS